MCVHVFGNAPSPAVATYCLRQIAKDSEEKYGEDIVQLISRNFYVDDGLLSSNTPEEAIDLVKRTQEALRTGGNVRLHKIASNSSTVLKAFPSEDHAKNLKNLDMSQDAIPMQRSLGLIWDIQTDTFNFQVLMDPKPYTRRGVLSTINGIFDPIGFLAPVIIQGKILLRDLMIDAVEWDEPLSPEREGEWQSWRESLVVLEDLQIPRNYSTTAEPDIAKREVHVFSDASEKAIAAACYLHTTSKDERHQTSFIMGKAKVAPSHGHTIPRLELCGAVLAVEIAECVSEQMNIPLDSFYFHTDSKVVLGYTHNESRRFYVYVSNRVQRIRKSTTPQQWEYVKSSLNPADDATRSVPANQIKSSNWFQGPSFLNNDQNQLTKQVFDLAEPNGDQEVRPMITSMATQVSDCNLGTHRFERFSSWSRLVNAIQVLTHIAHSYGTEENQQSCKGWHSCLQPKSVKRYLDAELHIIKEVQREAFNKELQAIREKKPIPKDSPLVSLSPQVDEKGLLRVGGRLNQARLDIEQKNPIIIPGKHHVATLLVRHHHDLIKHQGRHLTEGAVRSAGLWITGVKRLIGSILHICVQCRKLRGKQAQQKMSDLPVERITPSPPFTYVGVDTFGPWTIIARKTRGGHANAKRWAILFTCLSTRAVHIEVIEEMSSSSFINALRRFVSIRGPVTQFRSDRGTNFIGATDPLQIDAINVENGPLHTYLYNKGVEWVFNPPHSSHMGGVWERLIGVTRGIFDSMMTDTSVSRLTHDVLTTCMAEAAAIINARPLVPVSTDPENPFVLSPAMLLTHKTGPTLEPKNDGDFRDLYRAEWKRVQALAEMFWNRWRQEYMHTLQIWRKWHHEQPDLKSGDVVLLKDKEVHRNQWPLGVIVSAIPGSDGKVRKATVCVAKEGVKTIYTRPIAEMILLLSEQ